MSSRRNDARAVLESRRSRELSDGGADQSNRIQATLERMEARFDEAFSELHKARKRDRYEFRFKGNKMQFQFNYDLLETVEDAIDLFRQGSSKRLEKKLKGLRKSLEKRNKLLKMADRSSAGWGTVEEYLTDGLAEDSMDEKKIRAAEERASTKKRKLTHKRPYASHTLTKETAEATPNQPRQMQHTYPASSLPPPPPPQTIVIQQPETTSGRHYSQGAQPSKRRTEAPCFECGRYGHIRANCSRRKR